MKKKNLPMNMLHTFLLCIMFFLLAGLTSCSNDLNSGNNGCYSAVIQAFGYDMDIFFDGDSTNVPKDVRRLGNDIKVFGASIIKAPEGVSGSQPCFGCYVYLLKNDLNTPDIQVGDTIDFRIIKYKRLTNANRPCNLGPEYECSVKPCE